MTSRATPVEAEGESIDEAIAAALAELGEPRDRVHVEILRDVGKGLLGFGAQRAKVRVSAREDLPDGSAALALATPAASPSAPEILMRMLALMQVPATVETLAAEEPGQTLLRITSEAGGLLIGRHGQTLEAIEYLLNRITGPSESRGPRYLVDVEGYRERRSEELRATARGLAERARTSGRPQTMDPLSPRDRRVIHLALKDDTTVATRSVGEGALRRVVVEPIRSLPGRTA